SGSSVLSGRSGRSGGSDAARAASVGDLTLAARKLGGDHRVKSGVLATERGASGAAERDLVLDGGGHALEVDAEHGDGNDGGQRGDRGHGDAEEGELAHVRDLRTLGLGRHLK
ncbi:hypothetical protein PENTCL1PPCAC_9652, partial [Pristionchus entomophagus]